MLEAVTVRRSETFLAVQQDAAGWAWTADRRMKWRWGAGEWVLYAPDAPEGPPVAVVSAAAFPDTFTVVPVEGGAEARALTDDTGEAETPPVRSGTGPHRAHTLE